MVLFNWLCRLNFYQIVFFHLLLTADGTSFKIRNFYYSSLDFTAGSASLKHVQILRKFFLHTTVRDRKNEIFLMNYEIELG